jgi:formylglycine-generating enzyme required for sulfatase activity
MRPFTFIACTILLATQAQTAETPSHPWTVYEAWPFDAAEAKHRQMETAKALDVPVMKTILVGKDANGKPVTMDFMLIPAGTFVMGTPEPVLAVREPSLRVHFWGGWLIFAAVGLIVGLGMFALMVDRGLRRSGWPQFKLRELLLASFALSLLILGVSSVQQARRTAESDYAKAMTLYRDADDRYRSLRSEYNSAKSSFSGGTPAHQVTLTRSFYLGRTEVTQAQWRAVVGTNPSRYKGPTLPIEQVSWMDCHLFLRNLSSEWGQTRLPSEAEWEYSCRAGTNARYGFGDDRTVCGSYAWHSSNSMRTTHPVGIKTPNAWGLHDMHGNVTEWCRDGFDDYTTAPQKDPVGTGTHEYLGNNRVCRGGSFDSSPSRSANRYIGRPRNKSFRTGFRAVLTLPQKKNR